MYRAHPVLETGGAWLLCNSATTTERGSCSAALGKKLAAILEVIGIG